MLSLRRIHLLHRLVLTWFVLSLGVAIASPMVHPKSMQFICSASGAVMVSFQVDDDGDRDPRFSAADCPLCTAVGAPPPAAASKVSMPLPLGRALQSIPAARLAAATASPLPARGPPALL